MSRDSQNIPPVAAALPAIISDALLPLWFALVKLSGGNRRVALRIVRES
jgi:hypothetical protein